MSTTGTSWPMLSAPRHSGQRFEGLNSRVSTPRVQMRTPSVTTSYAWAPNHRATLASKKNEKHWTGPLVPKTALFSGPITRVLK